MDNSRYMTTTPTQYVHHGTVMTGIMEESMSVVYYYYRGGSHYESPFDSLEQAFDAACFDLMATEEPWKSTEPIKIVTPHQEYDRDAIIAHCQEAR